MEEKGYRLMYEEQYVEVYRACGEFYYRLYNEKPDTPRMDKDNASRIYKRFLRMNNIYKDRVKLVEDGYLSKEELEVNSTPLKFIGRRL